MEDEVRGITYLAIELLLASLIIGFIAFMGRAGTGAVNDKHIEEVNAKYMETVSKFYRYEGKEVSCSDAIQIIMTETSNYDYYFYTKDSLTGKLKPLTDQDGREIKFNLDEAHYYYSNSNNKELTFWSENTIRRKLKGLENAKFIANVVKGPADTIEDTIGIQFVYSTG